MPKLLLLFILFITTYAQAQINGVVYNSEKEPLVGSSVLLQNEKEEILAYSITNNEGNFTINYKLTNANTQLVVRYIGYEKHQITISKKTKQPLEIIMVANNETLEDVVVTYDIPIKRKSDTIIYSVDALKDSTDFVLSDVIKKMPGVDVSETGKIYYQGKEINKFYIESSDLLGKQYNLASDNLPVKDVKSIEVYERHQPIKTLKDRLPTDEGAMNIKLKSSHTKTIAGNAKIGISPILWDAKATPMFFSKTSQALLVAQSNNVGVNMRKYTSAINIEDLGSFQFGSNNNFRTINSIQANSLKDSRWRDNHSYLLTPNLLFPVGNDFKLRVNHSSVFDRTDFQNKSQRNFYTDELSNSILQQTNEAKDYQQHKTNILLEKNKDKFYFKNSLVIKYNQEDLAQQILNNNHYFEQASDDKLTNFENKVKILLPLKKGNIIQLKSEVQYQNRKNYLNLPTNSSALIQQLFTGEQLSQNVREQLMQTNHSLENKLLIKTIEVDLEPGFKSSNINLNTNVNQPLQTGLEIDNYYVARRKTAYINAKMKWQKGMVTLSGSPNISYIHSEIENKTTNTSEEQTFLPFEPRIFITVKPNGKWDLYSYANINQQVNTLNKNNIGYFINNAQNVSTGGQLKVDYIRSKTTGASAKYKNIFAGLFINGGYSVSETERDFISQVSYNSDGSTQLITKNLANTSLAHNFSLGGGKLFSDIHLNTKFNLGYSVNSRVALFNEGLEEVSGKNLKASLELNKQFTDQYVVNIVGKINTQNNEFFNVTTESNQYSLNSKFTYLPSLKQSIGISNEFLHNNQQGKPTSFLDVYWRKKFNSRYRVSVEANNILNVNEFVSYSANLNEEFIQMQELRPRQILIGVDLQMGKK